MLKTVALSATALSLVLVAQSAAAAPTIFPRPGNRLTEVRNTTTSTVLADSQDRNKLYVLPPSAGKSSLANASYNANVGFCAEVKDLQSYSRDLSARIAAAVTEVEGYKAELDTLRKEKGGYELEAEGIKNSSQAVREATDLQDTIEDIEARIDDLRDKRLECADEDEKCRDDLDAEIDTLKAEKTQLKADLREKRRIAGDNLRAYERLKGKAAAVQTQMDDVFALLDAKVAFIAKGKNQIFDLYKNLARLDGGLASVEFNTGWQRNVETVRQANPGFAVDAIATSDVRIGTAIVPGLGTDSYLASLPMILNMSIGGTVFDPNDPFVTLPAVPESITGTARMSVLGACAQLHPEDFQIEKSAQGLPLYGLTATYAYPSTFRTNVTAKVNMWRAYEYMKKVTTKGGFFSSSTRTQVTENTEGDSFVVIETFDESGLSKDEVAELERQIKLEVMQDVLRVMGVPQYTSNGGGVTVLDPPRSGAVVFADGVEKTCGWYSMWCTGISWVLRGAAAIWGSSEAEVRYEQNYNFWATRQYSRDVVSNRPAVVAFDK